MWVPGVERWNRQMETWNGSSGDRDSVHYKGFINIFSGESF